MSGIGIFLLILVGLLILVLFWVISVYNGLIVGRNRYKNAFAQIDVQLKRRYDLIPNLVECVKGYMAHEKGTLEAVVAARTSAIAAGQKAAANPGDPATMKELGQAEAQLGGALGRLIALAEAYPDLKANQNMMSLQEELTSTENKVGFSRKLSTTLSPPSTTSAKSFRPSSSLTCSTSRRRRSWRPRSPNARRRR